MAIVTWGKKRLLLSRNYRFRLGRPALWQVSSIDMFGGGAWIYQTVFCMGWWDLVVEETVR